MLTRIQADARKVCKAVVKLVETNHPGGINSVNSSICAKKNIGILMESIDSDPLWKSENHVRFDLAYLYGEEKGWYDVLRLQTKSQHGNARIINPSTLGKLIANQNWWEYYKFVKEGQMGWLPAVIVAVIMGLAQTAGTLSAPFVERYLDDEKQIILIL